MAAGDDRMLRIDATLAPHRATMAARPRALCHHDLHPGNTLWSDGRLSGLVDLGFAGQGWPELDVAYCALDLTITGSPDLATALTSRYEAETRREVHGGWRVAASLRALPSVASWTVAYEAFGITVDPVEADRRAAAFLDEALRDLGC